MSASAQAAVNVAQSIRVAERVASSRHSRRPLRDQRDAGVAGAGAERPRAEGLRVAVKARGFGDQRADIIAGPLAQDSGVPSAPTTARCLPSPVTSRSGTGRTPPRPLADQRRAPAQATARACSTGIATSRRATISAERPARHRRQQHHCSARATRPHARGRAVRRSRRRTATTKAGPIPTASSSNAPASSGMMTKVVSGIAMMFAPTPYRPERWKWIKRERDQRDFDHEAGRDQSRSARGRAAPRSPLHAAGTDGAPSASNGARRSRSPRRSSSGSSARPAPRAGTAARPARRRRSAGC